MATHELAPSSASTIPRRVLARPAAFWFIAALLALFLIAATVPTPMYAIYQQQWGFTSTALTTVFAIYSVGVLISLMLLGSLSDHIGRRPVLTWAVLLEIAAMAMLAIAPGIEWLWVGRFLQGIATGAATSANSGALLDFQPRGTSRGSAVNGLATAFGMAGGSLLAGVLTQFAPAPTHLAYFVVILGFALALPILRLVPEPVENLRPLRQAPRPQRPAVPAGRGVTFALMATAILASWTVGSMFMSLGPTVVRELVGGQPHLLGGLTVVVLAGGGGVSQLFASQWSGRRAVRAATPLLVAGLAAVAGAVLAEEIVVFFLGAIVLGLGWGLMFMGGLRMLTGLASAADRAGISATIYLVAYGSAAIPPLVLGTLSTAYGITTATLVFTVAAALFAAIACAGTLRRV